HVMVLAGGTSGRLAFADMEWARRQLRGPDPVKDATTLPTVKQVLKPGDIIEVAVKKIDRGGVHFQLEQTPIVEGGFLAFDPRTAHPFPQPGDGQAARKGRRPSSH